MSINKDLYKAFYIIKSIKPSLTRLIKLLYISELQFVSLYHKRFTNFNYIHYIHGPYIFNIQDDLVKTNKLLPFDKYLDTSLDFKEIASNINQDEINTLNNVIDKWKNITLGEKNGSGVLNYVYHTLPFVETKYNNMIDFDKYKDFDISEILISNKEYKRVKERSKKTQHIFNELLKDENINKIREVISANINTQS